MWTWKCLNPEREVANSKISGYMWTGPKASLNRVDNNDAFVNVGN